MKIRLGFVSNSSSSSFAVCTHIMKWVPHPSGEPNRVTPAYERVVTQEQEELLKVFGFYGYGMDEDGRNEYCADVICNQDCVMKWLITNGIPFKAHCHYGQEFYAWDGKSENLVYLRNFGEEFDMYSSRDPEVMFKQTAGHFVPTTVMTKCDGCEDKIGCTKRITS